MAKAKADRRLETKWGKALVAAGVDFQVKKGRQLVFEVVDSPENLQQVEAVLTATHTQGWKGLASQRATKHYSSITVGEVCVEFRPDYAAAASGPRSPAQLVADYEAQTAQVARPEEDPANIPTGAAILALDRSGMLAAAMALYQSLPTKQSLNNEPEACKQHLQGSLAMSLFRVKLPITEADALAMLAGLLAFEPTYSTTDFDRALVMGLAREPGPPSAKVAAALRKVMAKRRSWDPDDQSRLTRAFMESCEKLLSRPPVAPAKPPPAPKVAAKKPAAKKPAAKKPAAKKPAKRK
jgi:hypothetical protein